MKSVVVSASRFPTTCAPTSFDTGSSGKKHSPIALPVHAPTPVRLIKVSAMVSTASADAPPKRWTSLSIVTERTRRRIQR